MDEITAAALGMASDLSAPMPPAPRGPGRPSITPEQRAIADQKYAATLAVMDSMPQSAKEAKFAIYRARRRVDTKRDFKPLAKISLSEWKDKGFGGPEGMGAQAAYFTERWGTGRYLVEPIDELGNRITKLASWVVASPGIEEDDDMLDDDDYDDEYDDDRPRRRRRRRRDDDDDFEDDPRDKRLNLADFLIASNQQDRGAVSKVVDSSQNTLAIMMHSQQNQSQLAREEALRREQMEAQRREDERRRDEERRREDTIREDRRREDQRAAQIAEDRRREDTNRIATEASNKRMELMIAAATAVLPRLFEKKESGIEQAILASLTSKKEADPLMLMVMKNVLESNAKPVDPMGAVVSSMIEMQRMGNQMNVENTKQILALNGEVTKTLVTKILENSEEGGGNKNMLEQIMGVLGSASEMVSKLMPTPPAAPTQYQQLAQARQQQQPRIATQPVAPAADAAVAPGAPAQEEQTGRPVPSPEQLAAFEQAVRANPTFGVLATLRAIQQHAYGTTEEYQRLVQNAVQLMPIELRVAVLDNDEARVLQLVTPTIEHFDQLREWSSNQEVLTWLREYVPQLAQPIEAIYGAAAKQREEYVELLAQTNAQQQAAAEQAPQVEQPAVAEVVPTEQEAAPLQVENETHNVTVESDTGAVTEGGASNQIPFPGTATAAPASHLDDPDAP